MNPSPDLNYLAAFGPGFSVAAISLWADMSEWEC